MNHKSYPAAWRPYSLKPSAKFILCALLLCVFAPAKADSASVATTNNALHTPLQRLVVLDYQLTGDAGGSQFTEIHRHLLARASAKLRDELRNNRLFEVANDGRAAALSAAYSSGQNLHHCNGCEFDLAQRLNARLVLVPWVFRMSNLVLTMHIEIRDAASGRVVMKTALDFRGDNDAGWMHAIDYFIKRMKAAKHG